MRCFFGQRTCSLNENHWMWWIIRSFQTSIINHDRYEAIATTKNCLLPRFLYSFVRNSHSAWYCTPQTHCMCELLLVCHFQLHTSIWKHVRAGGYCLSWSVEPCIWCYLCLSPSIHMGNFAPALGTRDNFRCFAGVLEKKRRKLWCMWHLQMEKISAYILFEGITLHCKSMYWHYQAS